MTLSRRFFLLGTLGLSGCNAISTLNEAALVSDIFELQPVNRIAPAIQSSTTLLVLSPTAPAAITSDRFLFRKEVLSVTYLPNARWSDEVPQMMQSLLIQSLASSRQFGFVGAQGAGPVPDTVLLTRIDAFDVLARSQGDFQLRVSFELTVLRDRDQRVLGTRRFAKTRVGTSDQADQIARLFQQLIDELLPDAVAWVSARAS